jgi:protein transport protein SEC9
MCGAKYGAVHLREIKTWRVPPQQKRELTKMQKSTKIAASAEDVGDLNRSSLFGNRKRSSVNKAATSNPYLQSGKSQYQDPYAGDAYSENAYGGDDESIDLNRDVLFGNRTPPDSRTYERTSLGRYTPDQYDEYQREAQEDEEDIESVKQEIRFTKQESLASTRNAIRIASGAEETARNNVSRMGGQSERLASIDKSLDISAVHQRIAEDKTKELRDLNRSIFAVRMSNPFTKKQRAEDEERRITQRHEMERREREANGRDAYLSAQRTNSALDKPGSGKITSSRDPQRSSIAGRSRYMFEGDEDDVQLEKDIDVNLDILGDITGRLKGLALASKTEIDSQNRKLTQVQEKVIMLSDFANFRVMFSRLVFT